MLVYFKKYNLLFAIQSASANQENEDAAKGIRKLNNSSERLSGAKAKVMDMLNYAEWRSERERWECN